MGLDWIRTLSFRKYEVLGLDIGSSAVKVVALRKEDGRYAVAGAGVADIPTSEDDYGNQHMNTIEAIRECLRSAGVKRKLAVCGVCGPEVAVRDFEFPSLSAEEIAGAVLLEASQVCPFSAADSAVDHQLMSCNDDKASGVLMAATNRLVQSKVQLAKEANLKCVLMDVEGLALLNCLSAFGEEYETSEADTTVAVLDVGGSHATLAIMDSNGWPFIRDMTYAGDGIVQQIAMKTDMSTDAVTDILSGDSTAGAMDPYAGPFSIGPIAGSPGPFSLARRSSAAKAFRPLNIAAA